MVDSVDIPTEPGAMAVVKQRVLPSGHLVEFEAAPAGWLTKAGEPRKRDWRAYYVTAPDDAKRRRVESVTTICDQILPKDGLPPWSERQGIRGTLEALRRGLLSLDMTDDEAVRVVRSNQLGADASRDESADRGLNVHAILEEFMTTGMAPNPADHPAPHRPFIRGLVRWLIWADPIPVQVEMLVADPDRGYAGRLDLLARIDGHLILVDLKSQERGAIYESAHVQTRLYLEAEISYGEHQDIAGTRVVVVDGAGGFREMESLATPRLVERALDYYQQIKPICAGCESENRRVRAMLEANLT